MRCESAVSLFVLLALSPLACIADSAPATEPAMHYSQWGTPVCDDTVTDATQPPITVTGVVFHDANGNGQRDDAEAGLPGVCVSDGVQVTRTGPDGRYTLPGVRPGIARTIFVIVPTGYRLGGRYYQLIPDRSTDITADFGLTPNAASLTTDHAFAVVTDTHITRKGVISFAQMTAPPVAFIVVTGDLTNNRELDAFLDATSRAPVPVMALPGNHDVLVNGSGARAPALGSGASYESMLGPKYYAFNYGGRHYVLLNSIEDMPRQLTWLQHDLQTLPAKTEILLFQHFPPTAAQMTLYQQYGIRAVFSGHTHGNRVFMADNTLYVNTPPFLGSGLDLSPRTYRVVTFTGARITLDSYAVGYGKLAGAPLPTPPNHPPAIRLGRDWPTFNGDAARTGMAADAVAPPVTVAWRQPLGVTIHIASPVVGRGMVYIGAGDDREALRSGVYALDAKTGRVRWYYRTAAKVAHSVCLAGNTVVATSNDGVIHAINATTGAKRWTYPLGNPHDCWLYTAPVADDRRVYCGTAYHFTALDLKTGTVCWRTPAESAGHWPCYSSPALLDGTLFTAFPGSGVSQYDAQTGTRRWQADKRITISSNSAATPAVSGKTVYVRTNSALLALDADTGAERWRYANKGGACSPVVTATGVILGMGNGTVVKLDAATGTEIWSYTPTLRKNGAPKLYFDPLLIATPVVSGALVYAATTDGQLLAIDAATGVERTVVDVGEAFTASPAISGNTLFLASYTGTVYALVGRKR